MPQKINPLRIAIQKKGRITEKSVKLLQEIGINFYIEDRKLLAKAENENIELIFLRNSDIPFYVEKGICDLGIVGEDSILEAGVGIEIVKKLGFGKCRLSLASPKNSGIDSSKKLNGKIIATSFQRILSGYLKKKGIKADIINITGSTEIAPIINMSDAIADLVVTGSTLQANGLEEFEKIIDSECVLARVKKKLSKEKEGLIKMLAFRIESILQADNSKYVIMNAPEKALSTIVKILPGLKSPTVTPLAQKGMISIASLVSEKVFWKSVDKLKKAGASGILVMPVEKIII